jgi:hypothetical protein
MTWSLWNLVWPFFFSYLKHLKSMLVTKAHNFSSLGSLLDKAVDKTLQNNS